MNEPSFDLFLSDEISKRLSAPSMTWKKLDMCFKWRMIRDFLLERDVCEDDARYSHLRNMIKQGMLMDVEYNRAEQKINKLNHPEDQVCAALDDSCKMSST